MTLLCDGILYLEAGGVGVVEKSANQGEILRNHAVFAPEQPDAEQLGKRPGDVKSEGFERRTHLLGVAARQTSPARTRAVGTMEALADIGERASSDALFQTQQFLFELHTLGQD